MRKIAKNKAVFATDESIRKLFYLAQPDIAKKWTLPIPNWANLLNQLVVYFQDRVKLYLPCHLHTTLKTLHDPCHPVKQGLIAVWTDGCP